MFANIPLIDIITRMQRCYVWFTYHMLIFK